MHVVATTVAVAAGGPRPDQVVVDPCRELTHVGGLVRDLMCEAAKAFVLNSADKRTEASEIHITKTLEAIMAADEDAFQCFCADGRPERVLGMTPVWDAPVFKLA